jgi:hypothetical protein
MTAEEAKKLAEKAFETNTSAIETLITEELGIKVISKNYFHYFKFFFTSFKNLKVVF